MPDSASSSYKKFTQKDLILKNDRKFGQAVAARAVNSDKKVYVKTLLLPRYFRFGKFFGHWWTDYTDD